MKLVSGWDVHLFFGRDYKFFLIGGTSRLSTGRMYVKFNKSGTVIGGMSDLQQVLS